MAQGHKAASSSAATKTKDKLPIKQSGITKPKFTKKQIGIICGVIAVLVAALTVILILVLNRNQPQTETADNTETTQDEQKVDYNQKITDKDGNEFKAEYQAGSEQSFAMRFSDLKCEDNCKNVGEVKLGDKTLKQGEDYEVQSGSIIIILTENLMKSLKANKYDLVIAVIDADKTLFYGVKFTVKPEPTCGEGETLEKGECVKEPEEQPTQNQTSNTTAKPSNNKPATQPSQPSQPSTPSKSQAQIECENKAAPTAFQNVHWYTEAQKQELGAGFEDYLLGMSRFDVESAEMQWINGSCQPHIIDVFGAGVMPVKLDNRHPAYQDIMKNQGRDMIIWYWGGGGITSNYTIELR